mmetsp:Transcript_3419/g.8089  ORF Transcript_3419/g.8089 Transcript_3419/m.8089 type:complete len:214 (-) Transcript_3419:49-690(-)
MLYQMLEPSICLGLDQEGEDPSPSRWHRTITQGLSAVPRLPSWEVCSCKSALLCKARGLLPVSSFHWVARRCQRALERYRAQHRDCHARGVLLRPPTLSVTVDGLRLLRAPFCEQLAVQKLLPALRAAAAATVAVVRRFGGSRRRASRGARAPEIRVPALPKNVLRSRLPILRGVQDHGRGNAPGAREPPRAIKPLLFRQPAGAGASSRPEEQ